MKLAKLMTVAAALLFDAPRACSVGKIGEACCYEKDCGGDSRCIKCDGSVRNWWSSECSTMGVCKGTRSYRCWKGGKCGVCDPKTGCCVVILRALLEEAGLAARRLQDEDECVCGDGVDTCGDPHLKGLSGQRFDWSGDDGGWYCLVKDDHADLLVNVRVTAPLPEAFPDRQLITGLSIVSGGHSLVIEVKNPYDLSTSGCPPDVSPCLSDGGLRAVVDGEQVDSLVGFSRDRLVADSFAVSAANLPAECRQFGGDKIWARVYEEMMAGKTGRRNLAASHESFEQWILRFDTMAAVDWCTKYIAENDLADVQSVHSVFRIDTLSTVVRLSVGVNYQEAGEVDGAGRALPDLEFWQMDVGLQGLSLEEVSLSGLLGETARPVFDEDGVEVMDGFESFRGTVEDYRVSGPLGTEFALIANK